MTAIDAATKRAIRTATDEKAVALGARFNERAAMFACEWMETYCWLYEGRVAPIRLMDWQIEATSQIFGWQVASNHWKRWVRRFRKAGIWIPKKNGKSPYIAAVGVYLLIGDGEPGNKVYAVAKDGNQARIAHEHAMNMVRASPELSQECQVYKNTGKILHKPTNSAYTIVAGDNEQSQEGLNGSLTVDETHVCTNKLMRRIKRAGRSRPEALHLEASTAGDNLAGYGYSRYRFGKAVSEGLIDDYRFYFMDWSAPEDTELDDILDKETFVGLAKQTNPGLGVTVQLDALVEDWQEAIHTSRSELADVAMYSLNVWMRSSGAWLSVSDWVRCKRPMALEELIQYPCVLGLDLSKTKDLSALCAVFCVPNPDYDEDFVVTEDTDPQDTYRTQSHLPYYWWWHWIPNDTAEDYEKSGKVNLFDWASFLSFCRGSAIDYTEIMEVIEWLVRNGDVRKFGYDEKYADQIANMIVNELSIDDEDVMAVGQSIGHMTGPTTEFERLVINGWLRHNGNPLMRWQVEHTEVYRDRVGNIRPAKPIKEDGKEDRTHQKCDGLVAGVMATAMKDECWDEMKHPRHLISFVGENS